MSQRFPWPKLVSFPEPLSVSTRDRLPLPAPTVSPHTCLLRAGSPTSALTMVSKREAPALSDLLGMRSPISADLSGSSFPPLQLTLQLGLANPWQSCSARLSPVTLFFLENHIHLQDFAQRTRSIALAMETSKQAFRPS